MMIYCYTGKPGSGKGVHSSQLIYTMLRKGKNVITNIKVHPELIVPKRGKPLGHYIFFSNYELLHDSFLKKPDDKDEHFSYLQGLYGFANNFHRLRPDGEFYEHQTWFIIDEAQEIYNPRKWNRRDRLAWCAFYREHRKYGFDCVLISQDDAAIDKQIRSVLQRQVYHRKVTDFKILGKLLRLILGRDLFVAISTEYGMKKSENKVGSRYYFGKQIYYDFYNSMQTFRDSAM